MKPRILCATDLSAGSDEALRQADALARSAGGSLGICHVVQNVYLHDAEMAVPGHTATSAMSIPVLESAARAAVLARVEAATGRKPQDVDVFIDFWRPYAEVVKRAESYGADLLVVGSHGSTGIARMLLGSVAERVVRYAHCPVLVARPTTETRVVLAATDLSDASWPAVRAAADEARRREAKLFVAHVVCGAPSLVLAALSTMPGTKASLPAPYDAAAATGASDARLQDALRELEVAATAVTLSGDAAARIVEYATEIGAGLVVVATRGHTGLARLLLGSVAEQILRYAPCSVLAVRRVDG